MANFKRNTLNLALGGIILALGSQSVVADTFNQVMSGTYSNPNLWINSSTNMPGIPGQTDAVHFNGSVVFDQGYTNQGADVGGTTTFDLQGNTYSLINQLNIQGGTLNAGGMVGGLIVSNGGNVRQNGAVTLGANTEWRSVFTVRNDLSVGSGNITVQDGAKIFVDSGTTAIGRQGAGSVLVTGLNSEFSNSGLNGEFIVGFEGGSGQLNVQDGGQVFSGSATIGKLNGSTGQVTISGAGSNWTSDSVGVGDDQGTGTLIVENQSSLNANYMAVFGGSSVTVDNASLLNANYMDVFSGSSVTVDNASLLNASYMAVFSGSSVTVDNASLLNPNYMDVFSGSSVTVDNASLMVQYDANVLGGTLDVQDGGQVFSGSSFIGSWDGSTGQVTISGAGSNWTSGSVGVGDDQGTGTLIVENQGSLNARDMEVFAGSSVTVDNASLWTQYGAYVPGGTLTQSGGAMVFGDEIAFTDGAVVAVTGGGMFTHQDLDTVDNRGHIFVTNGSSFSLSGAGTTLDLTSGGGQFGNLNVFTGSQLNVSNAAAIQVNTLRINDSGTTAAFNNAAVTAGVLGLQGGSKATAAQGTQLNVLNGLSRVGVTGGSTFTLKDSGTQMDVGNIEVGGTGSRLSIESGATVNANGGRVLQGQLTIDNGTLNVAGTLRSGEAGTSSGTLVLSDGARLAVEYNLFVDATLTAEGSNLKVANRLAGTNGQVTLTGSTASVGSLNFEGNSNLNLTNTQLTIKDGARLSGGSLTQSGGATVIGDEGIFTGGAVVAVTGGGVVAHQNLGDGDNRGQIFVTNGSAFSLSGAGTTLDLTSGGGQFGDLNVFTGSQLNISDQATVNVIDMRVEDTSSKATFSNSTLIARTLELIDGAVFEENLSTINLTGNTTTIGATSRMILNGGTYNEYGDLIVNGELTGTNPVINIGSDLIINAGSVDFNGLASLLIGDDFLFGAPGILNLGSTIITMLGSSDDDGSNNHLFDLGLDSVFLNLNRLIVSTANLILNGNFLINELDLSDFTITLAGNSILTVNSFTGDASQIVGGTFNNNSAPVPEPTTLLLFGTGLLGLLGSRRFRKIA